MSRRVFGDGKELHQLLITPIGVPMNQINKDMKDVWKYGQERWSGMITIAMAQKIGKDQSVKNLYSFFCLIKDNRPGFFLNNIHWA